MINRQATVQNNLFGPGTGQLVSAAVSAALVGFAGSVAIVLEAARAVGATAEQAATWVIVLCLGIGVASVWLSYQHRQPIITAWSTPGAALIAVSATGIGMPNAVGAFIVAALLMMLTAMIKPLGQLINRIPKTIAAAMLAGILLPFCLRVVLSVQDMPSQVFLLIVVFFALQLWRANLAVPITLLLGVGLAIVGGFIPSDCCGLRISPPQWVAPEFQLQTVVGLALPFYIVTMASQNLAGIAVMKADGYEAPAAAIFGFTGFLSLLTAPFGGHSVCLSSITAAICTGTSCHPEQAQRWRAGIFYGICYFIFAVFAEAAVEILFAIPKPLITTVVGLALLGPLVGSIKVALAGDGRANQAAIVTFVVAASGVSLYGINAAPWSLVAGLGLVGLQRVATRVLG